MSEKQVGQLDNLASVQIPLISPCDTVVPKQIQKKAKDISLPLPRRASRTCKKVLPLPKLSESLLE